MKVYVDSDVILDVLLGRDVFLCESSQILNRCERGEMLGCTTALAIANIHYILRRYDAKKAKKAIQSLRDIFNILPVSDREIGQSLDSNFKDFEDGVQNFVVGNYGCSLVLTRNKKDYVSSLLKVLTPKEYLLTIGITH